MYVKKVVFLSFPRNFYASVVRGVKVFVSGATRFKNNNTSLRHGAEDDPPALLLANINQT